MRAPDAQHGATRCSTPCVWCSGVSHVSNFESRVLNSNGHLRTTGRDQVSTGRVPYLPVSYANSLSNSRSHRTRGTGRVRCSLDSCADRVAKHPHIKRWAPDPLRCVRCFVRTLVKIKADPNNHRTSTQPTPCVRCRASGALYCSGQKLIAHPTLKANVWCLHAVRPVHSRDFPKFPTSAIENITQFSQKRRIPSSKLSGRERNPNSSQP